MLERLMELLKEFEARLNRQPTFGWAVVTAVNPLRIQYDAQAESIAGTPDSLVSGLAVGDRVWCIRIFRRDIVLGSAKGGDTGWVNLPLGPDYIPASFGARPAYRRYNGKGELRGVFSRRSGNIATNDVIGNLPPGFRVGTVTYANPRGSGSAVVPMQINANGDIQAGVTSATTNWGSLDNIGFEPAST